MSSFSRATIKSIALDCAVSAQTVSRIVNGQESLHRPETVRKVRDAMDRLGFLPDSSARSMRSGRTGVIALLQQASSGSYLPYDLLDGISERLEFLGLQLNFARVEVAADGSLLSFPKILRERRADALLVNMNGSFCPRLEEEIASKGFPAVWLNVDKPLDCVRPDDFMAGEAAAEFLFKCGVRDVFYIHNAWNAHYSCRERCEGVASFCKRNGLRFRSRLHDFALPSLSAESFALELRSDGLPQGFVGYTIESLVLAMNAVSLVSGVGLADRPLIATFGHARMSASALPVSSLSIPFRRMGAEAVDMLLRRMDSSSQPQPCIKIPFEGGFETIN